MEAGGSREVEARNYLEKHRIMELLNYLTSSLLFFRPEKPRQHLISLLEQLRIARVTAVSFPFLMDHSNIVAMFEMMDTSNKGTITFVQYKEALKALGLYNEDEGLKDDGCGITLDKFRQEVNKRTQEIWSTF
ncbi:EF-hand calcium-binding domain-containing protein 10 isoform X1 [Manis javanica]|uniref:EF-hand calcium-binding domain-containing protein 10 isoform X1 n=1 Tax=Manis javanica TaxID=9974 RepID=UPI00187A28EB|nr:EF-hand calcium-binding domain-containing protein 10 [Manis javanica]KAI5946566.1 EF-hand calcium-binding domain-containing protein 10 [Manis javanica]